MIRSITIRNISTSPVVLPGEVERTIEPLGSLTLPYAEYLEKALLSDLSSLDVKVDIPRIDIKRVSVKDFGAMGDGLTDDTSAIQSAIDYVSAYGGGVVDVPIGIYVVGGILVDGGVFLEGESKMECVFKLRSDAQNAIISFSETESGMSKLRLVGNGEA